MPSTSQLFAVARAHASRLKTKARWPSAAVCVPLVEAHLRPDHRRREGRHARRRFDAGQGSARRRQDRRLGRRRGRVGKLIAERAKAAGHHAGPVRPRRVFVSWPGQGPGRRRPRGRPVLLRIADAWHVLRHVIRARAERTLQPRRTARPRPSAAATGQNQPRARGRRSRRQAGPYQPRRQGGQGRPSLRVRRAGRGRRCQGPRRLRLGQGARGARGDPQGDRTGQAQHDPRARCARAAPCITTPTAISAPGAWFCAPRRPAPGIIAGGPLRAVFETHGRAGRGGQVRSALRIRTT